jgi:hypothetical protein
MGNHQNKPADAGNGDALASLLNQPTAAPVAAVEPVVPHAPVAPVAAVAAVAAVEQSPVTPAAPVVLAAVHTQSHDVKVVTGDDGPVEKLVARKYKSFRVIPIGKSSLGEKIVHNCVDESEAKQVYYAAHGDKGTPSKYPVKVVPHIAA